MDASERRLARRLGRRIRRRRRAIDMTQEELSLRTGIHRTQFTLYESGARIPPTSTPVRLAAGLGVSVEQLVGGIGREPGGAVEAGGDDGAADA